MRAKQVRDFLATVDGPQTLAQIAAGCGIPHDRKLMETVTAQVQQKLLKRVGEWRPASYALGRPASDHRSITKEEARARRTERERIRMRKIRRSWAQYLADLSATRDARKKEQAEKSAARLAAKRAARVKPERQPRPTGKPVFTQGRQLRLIPTNTPTVIVVPRRDVSADVAAFLAKGGRIDVLPGFYQLNQGAR